MGKSRAQGPDFGTLMFGIYPRRVNSAIDLILLLAKVLGTTAEFWLNLQLVNDLWLAEHNEVLAEKLKRARPLAACLD